MSRKILKILISLLFLVFAAVVAVFAIKTFAPEFFETTKYGVESIRPVNFDPTTTRYGVVGINKIK